MNFILGKKLNCKIRLFIVFEYFVYLKFESVVRLTLIEFQVSIHFISNNSNIFSSSQLSCNRLDAHID